MLEAAAGWFESQLAASVGTAARDYLLGRGLSQQTIGEFRLGFAPDRSSGLKDALLARQVTEAQMLEAGLLVEPEGGGETRDKFRGRVMFPIADPRGRVIAFGGRAHGRRQAEISELARDAALPQRAPAVQSRPRPDEGARRRARSSWSKAIWTSSLSIRPGFGYAVAPLGTALTEDQLKLLWRLAPEPVLCFDGDEAGTRAAHRAMERAMPMLAPGTVAALRLPAQGRGSGYAGAPRTGADAMVNLFMARPLTDVLWDARFKDAPVDTPERRAGLEREIDKVIRRNPRSQDPRLLPGRPLGAAVGTAVRAAPSGATAERGVRGGERPGALRRPGKFPDFRQYGAQPGNDANNSPGKGPGAEFGAL